MKSALFICPLPPPATGQSLASSLLYQSTKSAFNITVIDLSKRSFRSGINSVARIFEVLLVILKSGFSQFNKDFIYFTVSESLAGNIKDILIYIACWPSRKKIIVHLHGGAGMRILLSSSHPIIFLLNGFFLKRIGAVVVLGNRLRGIYTGLVRQDRLHTVPNFAGDEFFVSAEQVNEKFKNVEKLRVLFLSNLLPGKGHVELLSALMHLSAHFAVQLHVDFAGGFESPEDEAKIRKLAGQIRHASVTVHGIVHGELKRGLLRDAHLFCLPTYYPYEGQPISILEAYASGCAVLTTDHSGIFDTFTPDVNGIEVKPRSPEAIVHALEYALDHKQALHSYAVKNLQQASELYRSSTHVASLLSILEAVNKPQH